MTVEGVDYSFGRPGGAALAAAGKHFAVRYVPYSGDGGKGLTRTEIADLHGHGISIALVFEQIAGRARGGYNAGATDAHTSVAAIQSLGFPADSPIYFAVDFDAEVDHYDVIQHYLDGAASVIGRARVGVYGGIRVINEMRRRGAARWFWQTYAWSAGDIASGLHLYQYHNGQRINGAAVDYVRAYVADYGQWAAPENNMGLKLTLPPAGPVAGVLNVPKGTKAIRVSDAVQIATSALVIRSAVTAAVAGGSSGYVIDLDNDELHFIYNGWLPAGSFVVPAAPADTTPFSQADIDAAVAKATAGLFTQAQLDEAIAADRAKAKPVLGVVYE